MMGLKNFLKKYPHIYSIPIGLILLVWFKLLEHYITTPANIIHVRLDDYIPFAPVFILPYIFWFFYIGIAMVYLFFHSKDDFLKLSAFLYIGMSICYTIYM
ncbi:MAG: phosphoesterase, partial [Clostridia bacterium]|nr:phosphoesterase [Clostridia bacterium]